MLRIVVSMLALLVGMWVTAQIDMYHFIVSLPPIFTVLALRVAYRRLKVADAQLDEDVEPLAYPAQRLTNVVWGLLDGAFLLVSCLVFISLIALAKNHFIEGPASIVSS